MTQALITDLINGLFEMVGAVFLSINVYKIWQDKVLRGVHWTPTVFFSVWGFWNLFYYPSLDQWFSFFGGICIVTVNSIWLYLIFYYYVKSHKKLENKDANFWIF